MLCHNIKPSLYWVHRARDKCLFSSMIGLLVIICIDTNISRRGFVKSLIDIEVIFLIAYVFYHFKSPNSSLCFIDF